MTQDQNGSTPFCVRIAFCEFRSLNYIGLARNALFFRIYRAFPAHMLPEENRQAKIEIPD